MSSGGVRFTSQPGRDSPVRFFQLSQLRRLRNCDQVAAICYRVRNRNIEFLLVRTNSGHWIFPKGGTEPGLTHAQAAALEAFEEAGVHGRIEEAAFTHYVRRKRTSPAKGKSADKEMIVSAHLCEVTRRGQPQEPNRDPTWFSPASAKLQLRQDRSSDFGVELSRVVDRAVARIQRLRLASLATAHS